MLHLQVLLLMGWNAWVEYLDWTDIELIPMDIPIGCLQTAITSGLNVEIYLVLQKLTNSG